MNVLYRADGSPDIGTGHIIRGLILARRLETLGAQVTFVTRELAWGVERLRQAGCRVRVIAAGAGEEMECAALREAIRALSPEVCVMDVLETSEAQTRAVTEAGCRVVCLDDVGPGRLKADAIVNVLEVEPDPAALAERGIALYEGPQYAALAEEYEQSGVARREVPRRVRRVLVTLGGADPAALAPKAARALVRAFESSRAPRAFDHPHVLLIIGSASGRRDEVMRAIAGREEAFTVLESVPVLLPALREADLGIVAGGLTMHEALAVGLPSIALCQAVRHQAELAQRFADQGAMMTLGPGAAATEAEIVEAVLNLAADQALRKRLAARGPQLLDGRGAQRVARIIAAVAQGARHRKARRVLTHRRASR